MAQLERLIRTQPVPTRINTQQFADGLTELVRVPLRVIPSALGHITDGNALHVGFAEEAQHHAETLRAHPNKRRVDSVTGGNVSRTAEHVARNNGETRGGE